MAPTLARFRLALVSKRRSRSSVTRSRNGTNVDPLGRIRAEYRDHEEVGVLADQPQCPAPRHVRVVRLWSSVRENASLPAAREAVAGPCSDRLGLPTGERRVSPARYPGGLVLVMCCHVAWADGPNLKVFPIHSRPYGHTYGQWSARWWQFAVRHTNLNFCGPVRPESPVAFIAGTPGPAVTTSCTVPKGQAIMFPLFNVEWSAAEAQAQLKLTPGQSCLLRGQPVGTSHAALQACASAQANHALSPGATLTAVVDGETLHG
jgi:hypothetical protein